MTSVPHPPLSTPHAVTTHLTSEPSPPVTVLSCTPHQPHPSSPSRRGLWLTFSFMLFCVWFLWCDLLAVSVHGHRGYRTLIPNGYDLMINGSLWDGAGHDAPTGGGTRNVFGDAFSMIGHRFTTEFCQADADGDGFSNGAELGDPDCVWNVGLTPQYTSGLSHPGYSISTPTYALTPAPSSFGTNEIIIVAVVGGGGVILVIIVVLVLRSKKNQRKVRKPRLKAKATNATAAGGGTANPLQVLPGDSETPDVHTVQLREISARCHVNEQEE